MNSFSSWHWIVVLCAVAPILGVIWYCAHLAKIKGRTGVAGWLAWFVFVLAITSPLILLISTAAVLGSAEASNPGLREIEEWRSYKVTMWLTTAALIGLHWWTAYLLTHRFVSSTVTIAKIALVSGPVSVLLDALLCYIILGEVNGAGTGTAFFKATILALIWIAYLSESKRVKRTYGIEPYATNLSSTVKTSETYADRTAALGAVPATAIDAAIGRLPSTSSVPSLMSTDTSKAAKAGMGEFDLRNAYRMIAGEIESGTVDRGIWLEALVNSGGEAGPRQEATYAVLKIAALQTVFDATERERSKAVVGASADRITTKYDVELAALQKSFTYNQPLTEGGLEKLVQWAVETSNVDLQSPFSGETLLHLASEGGYTQLVQMLVKRGAKQTLRNERGLTAREAAELAGQRVALMYL